MCSSIFFDFLVDIEEMMCCFLAVWLRSLRFEGNVCESMPIPSYARHRGPVLQLRILEDRSWSPRCIIPADLNVVVGEFSNL